MNERFNKSMQQEDEMMHEEEPIEDEPITEEERKHSDFNYLTQSKTNSNNSMVKGNTDEVLHEEYLEDVEVTYIAAPVVAK